MFGGVRVRQCDSLVVVWYYGDFAPAAPGGSGDLCGWERKELLVDLIEHRPSELLGRRDQPGRTIRSVLCLAEEVGCDQGRIRAVIGNHHDFCWTGRQIDPDHSKELALGLSDVSVPGPGYHVYCAHADAAKSH